jgi:hypothetical protein
MPFWTICSSTDSTTRRRAEAAFSTAVYHWLA